MVIFRYRHQNSCHATDTCTYVSNGFLCRNNLRHEVPPPRSAQFLIIKHILILNIYNTIPRNLDDSLAATANLGIEFSDD